MKIISCIKPVPDPASRLIINESKTWIKDQDLTFVASEADNYALEEALRLKEKHGGEVVVISMGGEEAARVLRSGLAMGADRAIHLLDPKFKGGDEFATAAALAKAIEKDGGADLVLAGVQSDDLGTGMTGTMMAEFLGWTHATVVVGVEADPDGKSLRVRRELEGGINETVELGDAGRSDHSIRNQPAALRIVKRHHGGEEEGVQSVVGRRPRAHRRCRRQEPERCTTLKKSSYRTAKAKLK